MTFAVRILVRNPGVRSAARMVPSLMFAVVTCVIAAVAPPPNATPRATSATIMAGDGVVIFMTMDDNAVTAGQRRNG